MTSPFLPLPIFRAFTAAGLPLAGGQLFTYAAGTTTPQATYSDAAGVTPNANPVILDSTGSAVVRLGNLGYKFVLKDSGGSTQWTEDSYVAISGDSPTFLGTITANALVSTTSVTAATLSTSGSATVGGNLTVTGSLSVGGSTALTRTNNLQTGAYQFVAGDAGTQVINTGATSPTYTVPPNATVAFTIGTELSVINYSTGIVTLAAGGGVTITSYGGASLSTIATMQSARIRKTGTDTWLILDPTFLDFAATSFTATLTGCTVGVTGNVRYRLIADRVILTLQGAAITGTSNATSFTFTGLPAIAQPTAQRLCTSMLEDNTALTGGWASVTNSGTVTFGLGFANNAAGFTNSGTKGLPLGWQVIYDL
jgi:hypothetical protein